MIMHGSGCSLDAHQRPEKPASGCGGGTRVAQHRAGWLAGGTGERRLRGEYLGTSAAARIRSASWESPCLRWFVRWRAPGVPSFLVPRPLVGSGQGWACFEARVPKSRSPEVVYVRGRRGGRRHELALTGDDDSPPPPPDTALRGGAAARGRIRRLRGDQRSLRHDVLRDERDGRWHPRLHPALRHRLHVLSQLRRVRTGRHALHACC